MEIVIITKEIALSKEDFLNLCLIHTSASAVAKELKCCRKKVAAAFKKLYPNKVPNTSLRTEILIVEGLKWCTNCQKAKPLEDFYTDNSTSTGKTWGCKPCMDRKGKDWQENNPEKDKTARARYQKANQDKINSQQRERLRGGKGAYYCAKYRGAKLQRTPSWADLEKIKEVYANCPEGYHVDHIIPLQGEMVSGLHVETNLQYLTAEENLKKGNKFE